MKMYFGTIEDTAEVYMGAVESNLKRGIWIQRDGTPIRIRDMSKSHIQNTIAMLERRNGYLAEAWIMSFRNELAHRDYIRKVINENW